MNVLSLLVCFRFALRSAWLCCCLATLDCATLCVRGQGTNTPAKLSPAARARHDFVEARSRFQTNPTNSEIAWHFARACFDLAEFARNNSDRAEIAETGISVARDLVSRVPNLAPGRYYLGMNLGQLARTKSLGALRLVDQMEKEFLASQRLDPKFDYAGSDRNLGLLYLEAPVIGSIGSRSKARSHLRRAVELAPDYPENRLILIEAYTRWGDSMTAAREFRVLQENWSGYRKTFSGDKWEVSWSDWNTRFEKLKEQLSDHVGRLEMPRKTRP